MTDKSLVERAEIERIADFLVSAFNEPWPQGSDMDRLHYWRDKCITAANDIRAALSEKGVSQ